MFDANLGWHGYADAKPSESIQKHELPGLAVAVVFPHKPEEPVVEPPIKQYKDYEPRKKGARARTLSQWLTNQKKVGLAMAGFFHAHTQVSAATLGMELIEELPNTRVERHHDTYRLFFGNEYVDFAQAVALEYYFFTINFGILRAGLRLPPDRRRLFVAMDRFPGKDTEDTQPGQPVPPTQGEKFIDFVQRYSKTATGIEQDRRSINLSIKLGNLNWWKWRNEGNDAWKKGKSHPHFVLPDWLAAAAIAHEFRDDFVASFAKERVGTDAANGLEELYNAVKTHYDLWSMARNVLGHIKAAEKLWTVPDDARSFILARAEHSQ